MTRPEFLLRLRVERPDKNDESGLVRLRRALKTLLRVFGLRAVSVLPAVKEETSKEGTRDG